MAERGPGEGQEKPERLRKVRQGSGEPSKRQEGEEFLRKAQGVGREIADLLGGTSAKGQDDVSEQIRQLARLRDEGHISNEEFETKKRELLERM